MLVRFNVPVRLREKQNVLKNNGVDIAVLWTALLLLLISLFFYFFIFFILILILILIIEPLTTDVDDTTVSDCFNSLPIFASEESVTVTREQTSTPTFVFTFVSKRGK